MPQNGKRREKAASALPKGFVCKSRTGGALVAHQDRFSRDNHIRKRKASVASEPITTPPPTSAPSQAESCFPAPTCAVHSSLPSSLWPWLVDASPSPLVFAAGSDHSLRWLLASCVLPPCAPLPALLPLQRAATFSVSSGSSVRGLMRREVEW